MLWLSKFTFFPILSILLIVIDIFFLVNLPVIKASGWAFLKNQSECQLECENNGVCAYNTENFSQHKCICFIGLYYGDKCQYAGKYDTNKIRQQIANYFSNVY